MARALKAVGDPDASVLVDGENTFAAGVPVGVDEPLPRTPMVFPPKEKHRKLDEIKTSTPLLKTTHRPSCPRPSWRRSSVRRKLLGECFLLSCRF